MLFSHALTRECVRTLRFNPLRRCTFGYTKAQCRASQLLHVLRQNYTKFTSVSLLWYCISHILKFVRTRKGEHSLSHHFTTLNNFCLSTSVNFIANAVSILILWRALTITVEQYSIPSMAAYANHTAHQQAQYPLQPSYTPYAPAEGGQMQYIQQPLPPPNEKGHHQEKPNIFWRLCCSSKPFDNKCGNCLCRCCCRGCECGGCDC